MIFYKTRYNHEIFHMKKYNGDPGPQQIEVECVSRSGIFDISGKKYMNIYLWDPVFLEALHCLERNMNNYFKRDEYLSPNLCVKLPFRYGKFEVKFSKETHYLTTSEDLEPDMLLRVVLELSTVYNFGVNWIIRSIMVLNK